MSSILDDPEAPLLRWYGLICTPLGLFGAILMVALCDYRIVAPIVVLFGALAVTGTVTLVFSIFWWAAWLHRWWRIRRDFPRIRVVH